MLHEQIGEAFCVLDILACRDGLLHKSFYIFLLPFSSGIQLHQTILIAYKPLKGRVLRSLLTDFRVPFNTYNYRSLVNFFFLRSYDRMWRAEAEKKGFVVYENVRKPRKTAILPTNSLLTLVVGVGIRFGFFPESVLMFWIFFCVKPIFRTLTYFTYFM